MTSRKTLDQVLNEIIKLDADHYLRSNRDLTDATRTLSETDRKLWAVTHFIKHGYNENRTYRLIGSDTKSSGSASSEPNTSDTKRVKDMLKQFRRVHGDCQGGVRDK
jgi:hypothetical protein